MVAGFAIGQFLDLFPEGGGFVWVFAAGTLFGFLGYSNLLRAPFPQQTAATDEQSTRLRDLLQPFHDANFRRAALFFGLWTFGVGLAGPLYSVFMLDRLQISYTEVSIFNALFMLTSIAGYRLWAGLIDRFGLQTRPANPDDAGRVPASCLGLQPAGGLPPDTRGLVSERHSILRDRGWH